MVGMIGESTPPTLSILASLPDTFTFAWIVAVLFVVAAIFDRFEREEGRLMATGTWILFGAFWLTMVPYFALEHLSYVESLLSLVAVPACVYVGYLLYRGRESLFVLTRAVAAMLIIYLPFETIPSMSIGGVTIPEPKRIFIEIVAAQTAAAMSLLGYSPTLIENSQGYLSTFQWVHGPDGHVVLVSVVLACTGIGSMAIFAGLITAVDAPFERKVRGLAVSIPLIYVLNIARTTFITIVTGNQYMHWQPDLVLAMFGASDPYRVSFLISDRIFSQLLAIVALIGITYLVARQIPELVIVLEDVLYVLTGEEHDLLAALDLPREPTNRKR